MRHPAKGMIFAPLMDWWVAALVLILIAIITAAIPVFMSLELSSWVRAATVVVLTATILMIVDAAFFSYYALTEEGLVIASQLRHADFAYRDITAITPSGLRGLVSFRGQKRFALSRRCYILNLRKGSWKRISISPAQRDTFIGMLLEKVDLERSSRANVARSSRKRTA